MTRIISIVNQKGGTGKTTTAVNLSHGLARKGKKVLLIDVDSQGNVGESLGLTHSKTLYHLLIDNASPQDCILNARENFDVIISDETLSRAEQIITGETGREQILKRKMRAVKSYDFVIIDCAPSLNLINQNALMYSNEVFLPVSMEFLALTGVRKVIQNLERLNEYLSHNVPITLVIPTFFDLRNKKSGEILDSLNKYFRGIVADPIRINVKLSQSPSYTQTIFEAFPRSRGAEDYENLVNRVLKQ